MLFNSHLYLFAFLPLVFGGYFFLARLFSYKTARIWLILASFMFYGYWNPAYVPLLAVMTGLSYTIACGILSARGRAARHSLMILGVILNLAPLLYYKYTDFTLETLGHEPLNLLLPLGISFFTFQQIAYLIDTYKGMARERSFFNYTLFVCFFPQLVAGPIVHHSEMMPQFADPRRRKLKIENVSAGLFLLAMGLFKKVMIADMLIPFIRNGFDVADSLTFFEGWIIALAFTLQIYFDFSGYTDMAIGSARMFNIDLPQNFNSPYRALTIQDFWRRWHMTLSRWLRDYVYIPLGGNRHSGTRTMINIALTFLIGGIWHGAGWTFMLWGLMHGAGMIIYRAWHKLQRPLPDLLAGGLTFLFVTLTWVMFRSTDLASAGKVYVSLIQVGDLVNLQPFFLSPGTDTLKELLLPNIVAFEFTSLFFAAIISGFVLIFWPVNSQAWRENFKPSYSTLTLMILMTTLSILNLSRVTEFLYFNF